jgi:hypothetical protein
MAPVIINKESNRCRRGCTVGKKACYRKLKTEVPSDPATPLPDTWKKCDSMYKRNICTPMLPAALLTIVELEWSITQPGRRTNSRHLRGKKWMKLEIVM